LPGLPFSLAQCSPVLPMSEADPPQAADAEDSVPTAQPPQLLPPPMDPDVGSALWSERSRCQSGNSQECAPGGDCAASELSTGLPSSPKNAAPEALARSQVAETRCCGLSLAATWDAICTGIRRNVRPSCDGAEEEDARDDLTAAVIQSAQILLQRQARLRGKDEKLLGAVLAGARRGSKRSSICSEVGAWQQLKQHLFEEAPAPSGWSSADVVTETDKADVAGSARTGDLAERLEAERRSLAESQAQLAEERRMLAECRDRTAAEGQAIQQLQEEFDLARKDLEHQGQKAMKQLQDELDAARKELELQGQQAAVWSEDADRLREELGAARDELERKQAEPARAQAAGESDDVEQLRRELSAARHELEHQKSQASELRAREAALHPELAAAHLAEKEQALLAEAAKEQANTQAEILRVKCHVAEADLLRTKTEMSELANEKAILDEELRTLRARQPVPPPIGSMPGGQSLIARHELASRSLDKVPNGEKPSHGYWFTCCSSFEAQPSKLPGGPQLAHGSG